MLKPICENVWTYESELRLSLGAHMPCRSTIVRLSGNRLMIHSPLAFDDATAREIDALGEVAWIVAPSALHHLFLRSAHERWIRARVFGPELLAKKAKGVAFERLPIAGALPGAETEILIRRLDGVPSVSEHALFHVPSKTLLVADLVFNVHACRGFVMPIVLRLVGAWKKLAQSRVFRFATKKRAEAARAAGDILGWNFDRVVMAHGEVVDIDAHESLSAALSWMTRGVVA